MNLLGFFSIAFIISAMVLYFAPFFFFGADDDDDDDDELLLLLLRLSPLFCSRVEYNAVLMVDAPYIK